MKPAENPHNLHMLSRFAPSGVEDADGVFFARDTPASSSAFTISTFIQAVYGAASGFAAEPSPGAVLRQIIAAGLDRLNAPGLGNTLTRWRMLAAVASHDLSLLKLYEGHTDALAILAEAAEDSFEQEVAPDGSAWGVWCAETPGARLSMIADPAWPQGAVLISGTKAWCSGAAELSHALVSGWDAHGRPCLAAVALDQPCVTITGDGWNAVGMAASASVNVLFDGARGQLIGDPGFYTRRAGFWHGGAGIAACWYGAAAKLAELMRCKLQIKGNPHALAHLGAADVALAAAAHSLHAAASWIDSYPDDDARTVALRLRLIVEKTADEVLIAAGRALGATAFCRDRSSARLLADLPVFLRQSHAEFDLAALGATALESEVSPWAL